MTEYGVETGEGRPGVASAPESMTVKGEHGKDFEVREPLCVCTAVVLTGPHVMKCHRAGHTCTVTFLVLIFH